jgi:ATP-binding cassette subfamily B protein
MALDGRLEATHLVLFVPWLKELYGPIEKLAELLLNLSNQLVCGERIAEILRHRPAVQDADDAVAAPPFRGEVRFDHVTFGYREGMSILRDLSFHVQPGQTVAIVGTSGAGKTTIANLLLRFFDPWEGSVQIDGQDVRHYTLESLRQQMTVVLQDSILFNRTIRENIAYGKPDAGWDEIVKAARAAEIHDFIVKLPESYETLLEEGATNLSGGQKQRLALARALLRDTPILILDEPVTQLDAITETRVNRTIARVTEGRTAFIIAHRLSTIQRADLILVIEEGRVAESGTHSKLIASSGFYRELYGSQYAPLQTVES